jgi:hypothetical protein
MAVLPLWAYIVYGCLYAALLAYLVRRSWRTFKSYPEAKSFKFYLLDMVAAMFGVTPTVWLAARAIKAMEAGDGGAAWDLQATDWWIIAGAAAVSQIVGLFMGRVHGTVPPQQPPSEWIDAVWVLGGAFFGLFLLGVTYLGFAIAFYVATFVWAAGPLAAMCALVFVGLIVYALYVAL